MKRLLWSATMLPFLLPLLLPWALPAQEGTPPPASGSPCSAPEFRQFDFWGLYVKQAERP